MISHIDIGEPKDWVEQMLFAEIEGINHRISCGIYVGLLDRWAPYDKLEQYRRGKWQTQVITVNTDEPCLNEKPL